MKKVFTLLFILAVCLLWPAFPLLAKDTVHGTGELEATTAEVSEVVTLGTERQEACQPTEEFIEWRERAIENTYRPGPARVETQDSFAEPTTEIPPSDEVE